MPVPPPWRWPRSAYIHVPFCAHHCNYCDFAVVAGSDHLADAYLVALAEELATLGTAQQVETLFIGGGTPTHLEPDQLARLLEIVQRWLPLLPHAEFTVEANPATLNEARVAVLAEYGVNRISLGAQSFTPRVLAFLERDHTPEHVRAAVERIQRRIPSISLDLIFGAPGQTLGEWDDDLRAALAMAPAHLSTYGLTYEKGTRLWKERQRGSFEALGEEAELALYTRAMDVLGSAGFEHYEISNHARPGSRSRHNEAYWANYAYFGFGVGAARYVDGRRELNTRSLVEYLRRIAAGQSPVIQAETLSPEERARETLVLQLRRSQGVERRGFLAQTGFALDALVGAPLTQHVELGFLEDDCQGVRLTRAGRCVADTVFRNLM